jgi:hypothetical protein
MRVISRMTEVLSFPRKRESRIKRVWIPSQAENDSYLGFPIDTFGNDSYYGSSIKDFEDDSGGHSRESGNPEDRSLDPQSSWG